MKTDVAIIGFAGRFPEAKDTNAFFENLKNGRDSVKPLSAVRRQSTTIPLDVDYQAMGYLDDVDLFDHQFFNISLAEAVNMDPRQRMLLEVVYETFETSGYDVDHFRGSNTIVYVGDTKLDYLRHAEKYDPTQLTGGLGAATAGRISRFFDLRGAALMIDTTCSSSLVALHQAYNELVRGNADYALVAGVNLHLFPNEKEGENEVTISSPDGKTRSFSSDANGTGSGEAVCCVLLKRLEDAKSGKGLVHAVLKGTAVNQNGELSASLAAPDPITQAELIKASWKSAKIDPKTISYIEAHGTGTKLGDPIEVDGISRAFGEFTDMKNFCALSSVKPNVGHADSASGLVGLIKTILALKNKVLFPTVHFVRPNPFIDFANSPVYVTTEFKKWDVPPGKQSKRRAGVNAFGMVGTNCHAVLEEAKETKRVSKRHKTKDSEQFHLVSISAKSTYSLKKNAERLEAFLSVGDASPVDLADLAFTLNCGRKHYAHRYAFVVKSVNELKLYLSNDRSSADLNDAQLQRIKPVFVFTNDESITKEVVDNYSSAYPAFEKYFQECKNVVRSSFTGSMYAFSFYYSLFHLINGVGNLNSYMFGDELGNVLIDVLQGKSSLEDGLKACRSVKTGSSNGSIPAVGDLLDRYKDESHFLLIGSDFKVDSRKSASPFNGVIKHCSLNPARPSFTVLDILKNLYLGNVDVDFNTIYESTAVQRIQIPTYQFQRIRCWVKEPERATVSDWFHRVDWIKSSDEDLAPSHIKDKTFICFAPAQSKLTESLLPALRRSNTVISVSLSDAFRQVSDHDYTIEIDKESSYRELAKSLSHRLQSVDGIIHLGNFCEIHTPSAGNIEQQLTGGLYSQFHIAKVFHSLLKKRHFAFIVVTSNANKIGSKEIVSPLNAMAVSFAKGIFAEFPSLRVRCVDLDYNSDTLQGVDCILREMANEQLVAYSAYRDNLKYLPCLTRVKPKEGDPLEKVVKNGSVYLVTGGASGIGLEIARSLAKRAKCTIIILGRTEIKSNVPSKQIDSRVQGIRELEQLGAKVEYHSVDISDIDAMSTLLDKIFANYPKITGVVHSAGVTTDWTSIGQKTLESVRATLAPKVLGTTILDQLTKRMNPGFFVLFSSLNSLVAQKNSADYAAANAFQNGYAELVNNQSGKYKSLLWPGWRDVGMSAALNLNDINEQDLALKPLSVTDGVEAFNQSFSVEGDCVIVANVNLTGFVSNPYFKLSFDLPEVKTEAEINKESILRSTEFTRTEAALMAIWYDVLMLKEIDIDDDFFVIGGHSLFATRVINRIEKEMGIEIEFEDILDHATPRQLAAFIESKKARSASAVTQFETIPTVGVRDYYDVSHAVKRLWLACQNEGVSVSYHMHEAFSFPNFDVDAFERAVDTLIERHEILRTNFKMIDGELKQVVRPTAAVEFKAEFIDLITSDKPEELARIILDQELLKEFDLENSLLLRSKVLSMPNNSSTVIFVMHHIISDGWSMGIIKDELMLLYNAYHKKKTPELPKLTTQYNDYSSWHNQYLLTSKGNESKQYWLDKLRGPLPQLKLPLDFPRSDNPTYYGAKILSKLGKASYDHLKEMCQQRGVNMFMMMVAALDTLLIRYSGQEDIIIGCPIAGRDHPDLENQIGFYVNTLPIRSTCGLQEKFSYLLDQVKVTTLEAFKHQRYPFDLIAEEVSSQRLLNRSVLFDVGFSWLPKSATSAEGEKAKEISTIGTEISLAHFDLWLWAIEVENDIALVFQYNVSLFKRDSIELMADRLKMILGEILRDPDIKLSEINFGTNVSVVPSVAHLAMEFDFQ